MILKYEKYVEKLKIDDIIDLYTATLNTLEKEEKYHYNNNKISTDPKFKNDLNQLFHELSLNNDLKLTIKEIFNKITQYEIKLYGDIKLFC